MVTYIGNGMYGMTIIDPKGGWPKASGDSKRMMDERPDFVVFNGIIEKYGDHPIPIKWRVGTDFLRHCRTQPDFQVLRCGAVFRSVYRSGNPANAFHLVQSFWGGARRWRYLRVPHTRGPRLPIGGLPVVDGGKLIGIVTSNDMLRAFLSVVEATQKILEQ